MKKKPLPRSTHAFFQTPQPGEELSIGGSITRTPHTFPVKLCWTACSIIPHRTWKQARAFAANENRRRAMKQKHHYKPCHDAIRPGFRIWLNELRTLLVRECDFTYSCAKEYGGEQDWKNYYEDRFTPWGALMEDFSNA
jgi:hypothetical protein